MTEAETEQCVYSQGVLAWDGLPSEPSEGTDPAHALVSDT